MSRYLIEVPHENKKEACERAIKMFLQTGSHFMTNADWGCADDEHKAWIILELDSKQQAREMLPPLFRETASIIELQRFSKEDVGQTMDLHQD